MLTPLLTDLGWFVVDVYAPSSFNDGARRDWPMKQPSGLLYKEVSCVVFKDDEKAACRPSQCGSQTASGEVDHGSPLGLGMRRLKGNSN